MMRPPWGRWSFMSLKASCVHRNGPVRLVSTTRRHCSKDRSSRGIAGGPTPALCEGQVVWGNRRSAPSRVVEQEVETTELLLRPREQLTHRFRILDIGRD